MTRLLSSVCSFRPFGLKSTIAAIVLTAVVHGQDRPGRVLPPGAEPPEYPTIPATNLPTKPIPESEARPAKRSNTPLDELLDRPRFRLLQVEVRDGVAWVRGRVLRHEDVWDVVEELREWPGVSKVVVGKIGLK